MAINILMAEDDDALRPLLCDIIRQQGYTPIPACNGEEALDLFFSTRVIDLCILDVMMPVYDGWSVLEEIRAESDVPVLMLTALADEQYEVRGLGKGADDYIAKPFSYPILLARIERLLKKSKEQYEKVIEEGNLTVDPKRNEVRVNKEKVELGNKEYRLLMYLIAGHGQVFTREQIIVKIWGYDYEGDVRTIDAHIKMLRKKLGDCGKYVQTIRGVGYKFEVLL